MARRNFLARQNCLVMAAPSSNEGFCLLVVEALLSGAQVVCSNIPVLREVGSDACTYFHPGADFVQNLSIAIISSIQAPIRNTFVDDPFVPDNIARELHAIYRQSLTLRSQVSCPDVGKNR
jgi:glycosyltransferase involved in cell wall biosynthesis